MRAGNVGWAASVLVSVAVATAEWEGQATMRVLRSSLTVEQGGRDVALSGARVASDRLVDAEDITFCLRFNYKRLDTVFQGRAALIRIQDWRDQPGVSEGPTNISIAMGTHTPGGDASGS